MAAFKTSITASAVGVLALVTATTAAAALDNLRLRRTLAATRVQLDEVQVQLGEARVQATHDALTGVANRLGLEADLVRRAGGREPWSVVLIDLDGFKPINDTHDHSVGDAVLIEVARRLGLVAQPGRDLVGRLGGDEFVVTVGGEQGTVVAQHVRLVLARPIRVGALRLSVTASIGVVQAVPGDDVQALLHSADRAMYEAKRAGKDRVAEFDPIAELAAAEVEWPAVSMPALSGLSGVRR